MREIKAVNHGWVMVNSTILENYSFRVVLDYTSKCRCLVAFSSGDWLLRRLSISLTAVTGNETSEFCCRFMDRWDSIGVPLV